MATAVVSRPYSAMDMQSPVGYTSSDTKVGDFTLTPGITRELENFYLKAKTPADREKCLELITALENTRRPHPPGQRPPSSQAYTRQRRPVSAMPAMEGAVDRHNPYTTTYKREFHERVAAPVRGDRPASTCRAYQAAYELSGHVGSSSYQNEFYDKKAQRTESIRSGSASGNKRNNPHPLESFMVWRLPQQMKAEAPQSEWAIPVTNDVMDKVIRGQLASTYQRDYLGIPQGTSVTGVFGPLKDWKSNVKYAMDSSTRRTYQKPVQQAELKSNITRYGCNKKKHLPANGAVPTVSERQMHLKTRTTYEREFNESGQKLFPGRTQDVRELTRRYGAQALSKQYESSTGQERDDVAKMLGSMNLNDTYRSSSSSSSAFRGQAGVAVPPTGCLTDPDPAWMSDYPEQPPECDVEA